MHLISSVRCPAAASRHPVVSAVLWCFPQERTFAVRQFISGSKLLESFFLVGASCQPRAGLRR